MLLAGSSLEPLRLGFLNQLQALSSSVIASLTVEEAWTMRTTGKQAPETSINVARNHARTLLTRFCRWTDLFAEQLQQNGVSDLTVNNQGIGGNSIVSGGLGLPLLDRYVADALEQTGVKFVMIFEGVNDIGNSNSDDASQTQLYNDLTSAYTKITTECKEQGLVTIGATITPFEGSDYYTPAREVTRKQINDWIMTSGTFDYAVDFSAALSDGDKLQSEYDSGDGLHPSVAGYQMLAESIPLEIFD